MAIKYRCICIFLILSESPSLNYKLPNSPTITLFYMDNTPMKQFPFAIITV